MGLGLPATISLAILEPVPRISMHRCSGFGSLLRDDRRPLAMIVCSASRRSTTHLYLDTALFRDRPPISMCFGSRPFAHGRGTP